MTSDDHEITDDTARDGRLEPPIWVPLDYDHDEDGQPPRVVRRRSAPRPARTVSPRALLAGGATAVLLAGGVAVGLTAKQGPSAGSESLPPFPSTQPAAPPPQAAKARPSPVIPTVGCRYVKTQVGSAPRRASLPRATGVASSGKVAVKVATSQGQLDVSLDRARTPCTVNNFVELAKQGFFNGTPCHRLTTRVIFVLQCGDPGGTGSGGPGYSFADESLPRDRTTPVTYPAGTIAMANAGPNTNGSQFFVVYQDTQLTPTWTVFGKVTAGLAVVQGVAAGGSRPAGDGKPNTPVTITSVTSVPPAR